MGTYSIFRGAIFHCVEDSNVIRFEYFPDGLMLVEGGKIVKVDDYTRLKNEISADSPITEFTNSLIIPGFIDTHVHYPQYKIIASYGNTLLDWLNNYAFKEELKFANEEYCRQVAVKFFDELIKNGTTTAMSFCTVHPQSVNAYFKEAKRRNLSMMGGKVNMDRNAPANLCDTAETGFNESLALIRQWHNNSRLKYAVTPRFAPTSTGRQLEKTGQLLAEFGGKNGVIMQTHMNENTDEVKWVQQLFPYSKNYFDVYQQSNLTNENSVFAHCIYNTQDELKAMADAGAKVSLCPTSNLFLGSGLFNFQQLIDFKIPVALGSDVGGGDSFSMFRVLNETYKICKVQGYDLKPEMAFYLAGLAGAKVLNLQDNLGNFEPNKDADFLVLDLEATQLIKDRLDGVSKISDILFSLMMLGDDKVIDRVFIQGINQYQRTN